MIEVGGSTIPEPGDPDLDLDISSTIISSWTALDWDFTITLSGGCGWWLESGRRVDIEHLEGCTIQATIQPSAIGQRTVETISSTLLRWADHKAPLRLLLAPGRLAVLMASSSDWLVLPRNSYPSS